MAQPSPLSAPCAVGEVAAATEAGTRVESFVIVNGSDLRTASVAAMSVRSCRSTGLPLVRASHRPDELLGVPIPIRVGENKMKLVANSLAVAALVLVTAGQGYAEPLRSTSIPSSLADDEKRLMPKVMSEFYGTFDKEKACWISKHEDATYCMKPI
jgi:hypothetical protein